MFIIKIPRPALDGIRKMKEPDEIFVASYISQICSVLFF